MTKRRFITAAWALCLVCLPALSFAEEQKLLPSTQGLSFGAGMAISQDTLAIGSEQGYSPSSSYNGNGYVDVYTRQASGWAYTTTVTAFGYYVSGSDRFGNSVALDGDWMAVTGHVTNSNIEGVYIFQRVNGAWTSAGFLGRSDHTIGGNLTVNELVVLHAGHLLVGVKDFDTEGNVQNSHVLAYDIGVGSVVYLGELGRPLQQAGDYFGEALTFVGNRLAVSAPGYVDSTGKKGVVFTYVFSSGQWVHLSLLQPDAASQLSFGQSLAGCLYGTQLAIAAPNLGAAASQVGFIATYTPTETGWVASAPVQSSDASPPTSFASSIACDRSVMAAAAQGANRAYRFLLAQGAWQQSDAFASSDPGNYGFAGPIVVSGRDIVVSDMLQGSPTPVGAAYAFNDDTLFANGFE